MANPFDPNERSPFTPDLEAVSAADRTFGIATPRSDSATETQGRSIADAVRNPMDPTEFSQGLDEAFGPQMFLEREEDDAPVLGTPNLLSEPKDRALGPTAFQQKTVNWSDGGENPNSPKAFRTSSADFLETDYEYGLKEGAGDAPVKAANVFGRQFTRRELESDDEGRRLLDLMQSRRRGDYSEGGVLANLARGFGDWSKSDIPYYGWVSDIGVSAGEAIDISKTMRKLQDGKTVTPHEALQVRRYMLQQELESTRTAAYQVGSVARQAIPFMAEMFMESMALAGIVGAATGGLGAIPGAVAGAAIAPAKLLWRMVTKGAPKVAAKVTDRAIAKYAAKGLAYGADDVATLVAKGSEVYGSKKAFAKVVNGLTAQAAKDLGEGATKRQIRNEALRVAADQMSRRAPEILSPKWAARMMYGADYRSGAETAVDKALEQFCLMRKYKDAKKVASLSAGERARAISEVWPTVSKADRKAFADSLMAGLKLGPNGEVLSGVEKFSALGVRRGMEDTTGLLVSQKYANGVATRVLDQMFKSFDLKYGGGIAAVPQRMGRWLGEHVARGFVQSEHAFFAGGLPTIGHAGFSTFNTTADALKEGLGRVFVEAPIQGAMQAAVGPMALAPVFAVASGHDASDAVFKGQLGFQANALLTGDRENMETARQCAIGSLFVEYMSESAGRGLGLMAGGALTANPLARKLLGAKDLTTDAVTGGVRRTWDTFMSAPLNKKAGDILSRAVDAVYGLGSKGADNFAAMAAKYVRRIAEEKGVQIAEAEVVNAAKTKTLSAVGDGLRDLLRENGIRTFGQLERKVAFEESKGSLHKAIANVIGVKLMNRGLTPDEIVRKFRQMGKGGGILEEMGEERLGDFVRGALHLDDTASDADVEDHLKSMFSGFADPKQLAVEFFGFAWPGVVRSTAMRLQSFAMKGALAETRERAARIRNTLEAAATSTPSISVAVDERDKAALDERNREGVRRLNEALGDAKAHEDAVMSNAGAIASGDKAAIRQRIVDGGGLSQKAKTATDGTQTEGVAPNEANLFASGVDAVLGATTEAETADELAKLARTYMSYDSSDKLENALTQTGASVLFGDEGVDAIRREWRRVEGHEFAPDHPIERSLAGVKEFLNQPISRVRTSSPISFDALGRQVMSQVPVFSSDTSAVAGQKRGLSGSDVTTPMVDEGVKAQFTEDAEEVVRAIARASLTQNGRENLGRRVIAKVIGLVGAATTGDVSLALRNPAAWQAADSSLPPSLLQAGSGFYMQSILEGFKAYRSGDEGIEAGVRRLLDAAESGDGKAFAERIEEMRRSGELPDATFRRIEELGSGYFHERMSELTEATLAGNGILSIAQGQSDRAVADFVASRHRTEDGMYELRDGSRVYDPEDRRFRDSWASEIEQTRDRLVDSLVRLASDSGAFRFRTGASLGAVAPSFAVDVSRAIKNGTSAEMMGAILSMPAFRNVSKVLDLSGLSEFDREVLYSAMNARHVNVQEIAAIDVSRDLDGADEHKVAYAMNLDGADSTMTQRQRQDAMKAFVRRVRLVREGGMTTFEDLEGLGREARIVPEYSDGGSKAYRAVVRDRDGREIVNETFASFDDARRAILGIGESRDGETDYGFSEHTKDLVITQLNEITSTDATSLAFYLYGNDRDALRYEYIRRIEDDAAARRDMLSDDPQETMLPPYLRKNGDRSDWVFSGPDAAAEAARAFRDEIEAMHRCTLNGDNADLWGAGDPTLTPERRRSMMEADRRKAASARAYEGIGDEILASRGIHRVATRANSILGRGNAYTCHLNSAALNDGNTLVVSTEFASTGDGEGLLRYGIRQALEAWRGSSVADSNDRNLLLAYAYRVFRECGERVAERYDRTDATKAKRVRDEMNRTLRPGSDGIPTSAIAAIASSSVFFSCDRGLRQTGNGFLGSPELAAVADEFRATDVFPFFASAVDEALGGGGFFHRTGAGTVSGLSAWVSAFGRDGRTLADARASTVFGDGKSARNPALVRLALRPNIQTADELEVAPMTIVRTADGDVDEQGLVRSYEGQNALWDYLRKLSGSCSSFIDSYARVSGGDENFRMSTSEAYRLAIRSGLCGGATSSESGVRARMGSGFIRTGAVAEADRIRTKSQPFELSGETANHLGGAFRRVALASGLSRSRGGVAFYESLRNHGVPEEVAQRLVEAYSDLYVEQPRDDAGRKDRQTGEIADADDGETAENHDEMRRIAGLVDNDDTTALSNALRWFFPAEGGSVSATFDRIREGMLSGNMLAGDALERALKGVPNADAVRANVEDFLKALSVNSDKSLFGEANAGSLFWCNDDARISRALDDVVRVLADAGHLDYATAVALVRDIPSRDGRRNLVLQMLAQMTVTDPMKLERNSDFSFGLDFLGSLAESSRTPNAVADSYVSLLGVSNGQFDLTGMTAKSLATGIAKALDSLTYYNLKTLSERPTQWKALNDILGKNAAKLDGMAKFKPSGSKAEYGVAADAADVEILRNAMDGAYDPVALTEALDNIQNLVWDRMQNMADAVDLVFGYGSSLAAVLRSRDALAYVRRNAEASVRRTWNEDAVRFRLARDLGYDSKDDVPASAVAAEKDRFDRFKSSGVNRLLSLANYFAVVDSQNKTMGEWGVFHNSAFLSDVVQEPLVQLARRLGAGEFVSDNGFVYGQNFGALVAALERGLTERMAKVRAKGERKKLRNVVREELRDIGLMKAALGLDVAKGRTPAEMDAKRNQDGKFDVTRIYGVQNLTTLFDAYVSSLPQSSRSLGGHAKNFTDVAKNRSVMTLPSDLPADIRTEAHALFTDAKVGGKSLADILKENGGRWADGSRPLVTVVGAKDVDGTLIPKENLAGILCGTVMDEFRNGNSTHVLLPFFRADKPACLAIRMPVKVATEWVKSVASNEKLMGELKPELADTIRDAIDALDEAEAVQAENTEKDPHEGEKGYIQLGDTGVWKKPIRASMYYKYGAMGVPKRDDVKSNSTFEAIINGERTSTTRYAKHGHMDFWRSFRVGDVIDFTPDKEMKEKPVRVIVTQEAKDFTEPPSEEEWSKAEGWAVGSQFYKDALADPKGAIQIRYRRLSTMTNEELRRVLGKTTGKNVGSWTLTPTNERTVGPTKKDQGKFNQLGGITKYVGFGADKSSTDHYGKTTFAEIANKGEYKDTDIVGVSVNGSRKDRVPLSDARYVKELGRAIEAGATIVADTKEHREKTKGFNIGETELADYLKSNGYVELDGSGIWKPLGATPKGKLYRSVFGLAMTAAGQADIDPKRVATTLSVGPFVPLYRPASEDDKDSACHFVSVVGGRTGASLTGGYLISGCGSDNVRSISERVDGHDEEAEKIHITSPVGVFFKKGQANDYGFGFDEDGYTTTLASIRYYQGQGRREIERILGLPANILDPVEAPKDADDARMTEWRLAKKAPHDDAVAKAKAFLRNSTVIVDDLETNKAGIFGSSCGFAWDGKSDFRLSVSTTTTNEVTGKSKTTETSIVYRKGSDGKRHVFDGDGNALSGGWDVEPDLKKDAVNGGKIVPIMWALSALCMAKRDGKLTNAEVNSIRASFRLQNGRVADGVTIRDTGLLADGDSFNVRNDGSGNAVVAFRTRNAHAQVVAQNANPAAPEYDHSFATNATRDMEMLEELANAELGTATHRFVDAHAGYSLLQLASIESNPEVVAVACQRDPELVEAYRAHPFDPEVRDKVAQKVGAFLRRQAIIGFYGTHGVMCPSAGNGHTPVRALRGSHTVKIEWLPGTTQYDRDVFRPARIYGSREKAFYGRSRDFGSGCVNVRSEGFRYGLYLDEAEFAKFCSSEFFTANRHVSVGYDDVSAEEWRSIEECSLGEAKTAVNLIRAIRIATKDADAKAALLACFTDYSGKKASESEGSKDARFDDLFGEDGKFDLAAIGIGRSRRNSPLDRDSAVGSIYLAGSHFCAHRSPSGNIEAFQGTVRATAPIRFNARTGAIGNEAKYALDPVTMMLQGSDTDGDSAGLQFYDYTVGDDVKPEDIEAFTKFAAWNDAKGGVMDYARRKGWTETEEYLTLSGGAATREFVKEDVLRQFMRAAFVAQIRNYERAETFHQGQANDVEDGTAVSHGAPESRAPGRADGVWTGAEYVDRYAESDPGLLMTREMDNEFVCDYGWAGRQPVGTDAVWEEEVGQIGSLPDLSGDAIKILEKVDDAEGMSYADLLGEFVDAAGYREKTQDLLDPEKSAMLSDAASDSAKARGVSVFHQSRFLRAFVREAVDGLSIPLVRADGYAPMVDLVGHLDGISNNLFDTLKKMFATRAGWTQQMLPFMLGQTVRHAAKRLAKNPDAQLGNAFFFAECANFLADLARRDASGAPTSTMGRLAEYLDPVDGRKSIVRDATAAGLKAGERMSAEDVAEAYCRARRIRILEPGRDKPSTPRGKAAIIVCANRIVPATRGFDVTGRAAQTKESDLLATQRVLDRVREFGEMVDYMVDAGKDVAGQASVQGKLDDAATGVGKIQQSVVDAYATAVQSLTDSYDRLAVEARGKDDADREAAGSRDRYADRRENPVAEGVELDENHQRLSHLLGMVIQRNCIGSASKFGKTTGEFVRNFADAVRSLSNGAWENYDGTDRDAVRSLFRALDAKDGRIDLSSRTTERDLLALREGFDRLCASAETFTLAWMEGEKERTAVANGSEIAGLLILHASATRPFGATESYAGQSNLPAVFGDGRISALEKLARILSRRSNGSFTDAYIDLVRRPAVTVLGSKAFDFMGSADALGALGAEGAWEEDLEIYANLLRGSSATPVDLKDVYGDDGSWFEVSADAAQAVPIANPAFGTPLATSTELIGQNGPISAFRDKTGMYEFSTPEAAYNASLAITEAEVAQSDDPDREVRFLEANYRLNGNRAMSDRPETVRRRLRDIIADAASRDPGVFTILKNAGVQYITHVNPAMEAALNDVANMIDDGRIERPGPRARMASELGGNAIEEDATATREDFLERVSVDGWRGATGEQMAKTIPQAIERGFREAFGEGVSVTVVQNGRGEPTNLLKVVRRVRGKSIVTYVSYGDTPRLEGMSREDKVASLLDMVNTQRAATGREPLSYGDIDALSGHDMDALLESFRLAGLQVGESRSATSLGFAPVMSGVIRLSTDAGFDTLFHEYFHQMLSCFKRMGVYGASEMRELQSWFHGADGRFDEETAADAYARFLTGSRLGWDELKLRDAVADAARVSSAEDRARYERTVALFERFRNVSKGYATALRLGYADDGRCPVFVYATMVYGDFTQEQLARLTEPTPEQTARIEDYLLHQRGQFALIEGRTAEQIVRIHDGVAAILAELREDRPSGEAIRAALAAVSAAAHESAEPTPAVDAIPVREESYETLAGRTSAFLRAALTRFRRNGDTPAMRNALNRYAAESVNGSASASEVVYAARRLLREVAALEGFATEDADGNLNETGRRLLSDHNVAELAMRLIANTEAERGGDADRPEDPLETRARHAGADYTFARALEHVAPNAYWRFCRAQAETARDRFAAAAASMDAKADALGASESAADRGLAESYRRQATELRGLADHIVPLAHKIAAGLDLHDEFPSNPNTGNLHGLAFRTFSGGARFGENHASSDGISRYDASKGSSYEFDLADPAIAAAFDFASMAFYVAEAARKYNSIMGNTSRDRVIEGVGDVEGAEEVPESEAVPEEIAEGGESGRADEMRNERAVGVDYGPYEMAEAYDTTPDFILSNPGTWLLSDVQSDLAGSDMRGMLTDHTAQAACEEGFALTDAFNQTIGLDTWVGDGVREMKRRVSNLGENDAGDFAHVDGKRATTVFSNTRGALLGMLAWGERRVGEPCTRNDIRMAHWIGQVVLDLSARERYRVTGVEVRSLAMKKDIERLGSSDWAKAFSPAAVIARHAQTAEQKRANPETALDLMLYRLAVSQAEEILGATVDTDDLSRADANGLYRLVVSALRNGMLRAEELAEATDTEPDYQGEMLRALRTPSETPGGWRERFAVKGGDGRTFIAVSTARSVAAWRRSEMYRKLSKAGRPPELLDPYYWAGQFAAQFGAVNAAAARSRYMRSGLGSSLTLAGTPSYWFYGGTGAHAMDVAKYQNALQALSDAEPTPEDRLRVREGTLFDILDSISPATLRKRACAADGSSVVSERSLKYLAYLIGATGRNDASFDATAFAAGIARGDYDNDDYAATLAPDMTVADFYMTVNRLAEQQALDELAGGADLPRAERMERADRLKVTARIAEALKRDLPGTVVARSQEQEFLATGRLGDSATAGETLVRMCREFMTAERFRGGLAQMLVTVTNEGLPNYVVNPTDEVVDGAGLPDEYWGALARFAVSRFGLRYSLDESYDGGRSGVENMRTVYGSVVRAMSAEGGSGPKYHRMNVSGMKADRMFSDILCTDSGTDAAGNQNVMTDFLQKGEADCYMRQLFSIWKSPSVDSAWQRLDRVMSWTKIASVGFSAFFNVATVFESATAATGFWHTIMGMTKTGSNLARAVGRATGRRGGTGAFQADAVFMSDLAEYLNSDDPFVRRARELCDLIGMPLDRTFKFLNDSDGSNPGLGHGGIVKNDIEAVTKWASLAGWKPGAVRRMRKTLQFLYEAPTDYTFNVVLNAVKMSVVMQTMRRLREECVRGNRPFDPVRELRKYSAYVNAEIGGIDPARYAWATPEMRKILSLGMFSWQWTVGAWVAGGGEAVTDAVFGGHASTPELRARSFVRWLRMLGIVKFGVPVVLQAAIKALSKALAGGLPPDDESEELKREIDAMPWFCPLNESKVGSLNFDVTPLLKLSARIPGVRALKEANVPVVSALVPAYVGSGGRNTTGKRRYYMHFGKQSDEFFRWFEDPVSQLIAKSSIPVQKLLEGFIGNVNPNGYRKAFADKGLIERFFNTNFTVDENATANILSMFTSFSSQSVASNPDAGFLSAVGPMKMGESKRSARLRVVRRLNEFVEDHAGRNDPWSYARNRKRLNQLCTDIFREAQLNGIPPDKLLSSALGDVAKVQYGKLMKALPTDPSESSKVDGYEALRALRALTRVNKKYRDIKSAVLQKYENAGVDVKKSPAMRRAILDLVRAVQADPLHATPELTEEAFERYFAHDELLRRSTHMDDRGGENFGNFLATDDVPPTLFGVPVVSDGYSEADLEFFREHPEAGGFYDLGEGGTATPRGPAVPPDGGDGGSPVRGDDDLPIRGDEKGGDAGWTLDRIARKNDLVRRRDAWKAKGGVKSGDEYDRLRTDAWNLRREVDRAIASDLAVKANDGSTADDYYVESTIDDVRNAGDDAYRIADKYNAMYGLKTTPWLSDHEREAMNRKMKYLSTRYGLPLTTDSAPTGGKHYAVIESGPNGFFATGNPNRITRTKKDTLLHEPESIDLRHKYVAEHQAEVKKDPKLFMGTLLDMDENGVSTGAVLNDLRSDGSKYDKVRHIRLVDDYEPTGTVRLGLTTRQLGKKKWDEDDRILKKASEIAEPVTLVERFDRAYGRGKYAIETRAAGIRERRRKFDALLNSDRYDRIFSDYGKSETSLVDMAMSRPARVIDAGIDVANRLGIIPANAAAFARDVVSKGSPWKYTPAEITLANYTPEERDFLYDLLDRHGWKLVSKNDLAKYLAETEGRGYGSHKMTLKDRLKVPSSVVETSIGAVNVKTDRNGEAWIDELYDFNTGDRASDRTNENYRKIDARQRRRGVKGLTYEHLRAIAPDIAHTSKDPDREKIRIRINLNELRRDVESRRAKRQASGAGETITAEDFLVKAQMARARQTEGRGPKESGGLYLDLFATKNGKPAPVVTNDYGITLVRRAPMSLDGTYTDDQKAEALEDLARIAVTEQAPKLVGWDAADLAARFVGSDAAYNAGDVHRKMPNNETVWGRAIGEDRAEVDALKEDIAGTNDAPTKAKLGEYLKVAERALKDDSIHSITNSDSVASVNSKGLLIPRRTETQRLADEVIRPGVAAGRPLSEILNDLAAANKEATAKFAVLPGYTTPKGRPVYVPMGQLNATADQLNAAVSKGLIVKAVPKPKTAVQAKRKK